MAFRPAPVGTASANRPAPSGDNSQTTAQHIAVGHVGLHQPLAEGVVHLNFLDLLTDQSASDPAPAERPGIDSSETVRSDSGSTTTVKFEDGSSLVVVRSHDDDSVTTTSTRTAADGTVTTAARTVTHVDDNIVQTVQTDSHGTTTTIVSLEDGTRTTDRVEADGDHVTLVQTQGLDGLTGSYTLVQADGDAGTLDYSLTRDGDTQTFSIEGTTADGVAVDSTVVVDLDTKVVTVTDHQGDIATYSLQTFHDQILDVGLIGLIADVDTGYFG